MKAFANVLSDVRYWLFIPSGFFFGILFGLYLGHYYQGSIPILYIEDRLPSSGAGNLSKQIVFILSLVYECRSVDLVEEAEVDRTENGNFHRLSVCSVFVVLGERIKRS